MTADCLSSRLEDRPSDRRSRVHGLPVVCDMLTSLHAFILQQFLLVDPGQDRHLRVLVINLKVRLCHRLIRFRARTGRQVCPLQRTAQQFGKHHKIYLHNADRWAVLPSSTQIFFRRLRWAGPPIWAIRVCRRVQYPSFQCSPFYHRPRCYPYF